MLIIIPAGTPTGSLLHCCPCLYSTEEPLLWETALQTAVEKDKACIPLRGLIWRILKESVIPDVILNKHNVISQNLITKKKNDKRREQNICNKT